MVIIAPRRRRASRLFRVADVVVFCVTFAAVIVAALAIATWF